MDVLSSLLDKFQRVQFGEGNFSAFIEDAVKINVEIFLIKCNLFSVLYCDSEHKENYAENK